MSTMQILCVQVIQRVRLSKSAWEERWAKQEVGVGAQLTVTSLTHFPLVPDPSESRQWPEKPVRFHPHTCTSHYSSLSSCTTKNHRHNPSITKWSDIPIKTGIQFQTDLGLASWQHLPFNEFPSSEWQTVWWAHALYMKQQQLVHSMCVPIQYPKKQHIQTAE